MQAFQKFSNLSTEDEVELNETNLLAMHYYDQWQVRTHFARPNWKNVFARIASKHPYSTIGINGDL